MLVRLAIFGIKPAMRCATRPKFSTFLPLRCKTLKTPVPKRFLCHRLQKWELSHSVEGFLGAIKTHFKDEKESERNVKVFTDIIKQYLPRIHEAGHQPEQILVLGEALGTIAYAVNMENFNDLYLTLYYNRCLSHMFQGPLPVSALDAKEKEVHFTNLKLIDELYLRNPKRNDLLPAIATATLLTAFTDDSNAEKVASLAINLLNSKGDPDVVKKFRETL